MPWESRPTMLLKSTDDASGKIILSHATWTPSCPYEMRESYLPTKRAPGSLRGNQGPKA